MCMCVEIWWSWLLHSMIWFFLHLLFGSMAMFLSSFFFSFFYGPSCVHIFVLSFFLFPYFFHSPCLICKDCGERSCLETWSIYLVEMERYIFAYFQCRSRAYIWWSVCDLDLRSMINFSTRVNKVWQSSIQRQATYVEGFQHIAWYLALVGNLTIEEKWGY